MVSRVRRSKFSPSLISLAVAACFATGPTLANPTGPTVVNGQVSVNQAGNLLSITNSRNAIINWQAFSIGANEITRFTQQSATSAVLNRVVGAGGPIDPSVILGALQSNGRVFLLNPSGIVFGAGSQIDVAGLVASSLNLSNADFLGGKLKFTEVPGAGAVVNQGAINAASGGQVYLVGPAVTNSGIITSPQGEVILAAGKSVELVNPGTPNLRVEITAPDNEAKNLGNIVAEAGRVGIYAGLVSHSGAIRADSALATADGRIVLKATRNTTVEAGSVLSANGPAGGEVTIQSGDTTLVSGTVSATGSAGKGGQVEVLGNLVGVLDGSRIDVSGETGGGKALVGGDFQGKNPDVQNAFRTYFGPNATISANAVGKGDGGTVIVWSDDATGAYGSISARGGRESGNGGFVETSSRGWLDFHARVDTTAPKGRTGTLLLDPIEVCIYDTNAGACGSGGTGSFTSGGAASIFTSSGTGVSLLSWSGCGGTPSIVSNLASNNVIITTSNGVSGAGGNITVVEGSPDLMSPNFLQLVAHNNVTIGGSIFNGSSGDIRVIAGWNESGTPVSTLVTNPAFDSIAINPGAGDIVLNATISTVGNVLMRAGHDISVNNTTSASGNVLMRAGHDINVNGFIGAGNQATGTSWSLTLDAGNALNITNSSLGVTAGAGGGTATMALAAGAGGISIMGAEGFVSGGGGGGAAGGSAVLTMTTIAGGPVLIQNSTLDVSGGEGTGGTFGAPASAGGNAAFSLSASGPTTIDTSRITVAGGQGGFGGSGSDGINAGAGGNGGLASFTTSAPSVSIANSTLEVFGGSGGGGGSGFGGVRGGDGGAGGNATMTWNPVGAVAISGTSSISVAGGRGGSGGFAETGGRGGNGGAGGNAMLTLNSTGALAISSTSGTAVDVRGGAGGSGGSASSMGGMGGNGGNGGTGNLAISAASIAVTAGNLFVAGGDGGQGGSAFGSGVTGGHGANGGPASFSATAASITVDGTSIEVFGGSGGRGGTVGSGGVEGNGGNGGNASGTVTATNVTLTDSTFFVSGGPANGFSGLKGAGGNAIVAVNSGGNVAVQNGSFIGAEGGAGAGGGAAQVIVAGDGSVVVSNSFIAASGGSSETIGGLGNISIGSARGPVSIMETSVGAVGGSGATQGGLGQVTLIAQGAISLTSSSVIAFGGSAETGIGGKGNLGVSTPALFSMVDSHVGAFGGFGPQQGGDAMVAVVAGSVRLESTATESQATTLIASGGPSDGTPGAATATLKILDPTGQIEIINERVDVAGGEQSATLALGPGLINVIFDKRLSGGIFVNGVEGVLTVGEGTTSDPLIVLAAAAISPGAGFFVNGAAAVAGTNFFVTHAAPPPPEPGPGPAPEPLPVTPDEPPPRFDAQLVNSLTQTAQDLAPKPVETPLTKEQSDKKKKDREC